LRTIYLASLDYIFWATLSSHMESFIAQQ